jgi:hypothetical protein
MRNGVLGLLVLALAAGPAAAEVIGVSITARSVVAGGQAFGETGPYERLVGRIAFAIDPEHPRNKGIVDLALAPRGRDKRVHFSADLYVLQPVDPAKGNAALLFEIANRGRKGLLTWFNGAPPSHAPSAAVDFGDGFLLREGYTLVWVGWQFDVAAPLLGIDAPRPDLQRQSSPVRITFTVDQPAAEVSPADLPRYLPADPGDPAAALTVRDRFWAEPAPIARKRWRFVPSPDRPRIHLDGGFEPGRIYELSYRSLDAYVAGVGFAAIRDAAAAFKYRGDLPVKGRYTYVFGASQSGRFLRQFLAEGFNVDEQGRRVFDAVWPHIAGAGLGSFNERLAMPGYSSFPATRFPFADTEQPGPGGVRGGILSGYAPEHQPKVIYTNTSVEYWGQGRAAALTHTSIDGTTDLRLPDNVRTYLLASTQHSEGRFPPQPGGPGQQHENPMPQAAVLRALLRALHRWVAAGTPAPESRYPKLADGTLVRVEALRFPKLPGVADPRTVEGPGLVLEGKFIALPLLVPQVDADGNELAGIRVPEAVVPLATTTGWNFRSERVGNPAVLYPLIGSYIPFARTRAEREARGDPRRSIAERYRSRDDYLRRIDAAARELVNEGYLLDIDLPAVRERAARHWDHAVGASRPD